MSDIQEFDFNVDLLKAILWQYNEAETLQALLNSKQDWYNTNQNDFWQNWITDVFDLRTANDFGLQVWSIILGQSIYTNFTNGDPSGYFGFGQYNKNFENGNFAALSSGNNVYSTDVARALLQLRYFQLISSGTVPETNRMLKYVFGESGAAYLIDNLDMTQTYIFEFSLSSEMTYMLNNTDILPRPAGVGSAIVDNTLIIIDDIGDFLTTDSGSILILG